MIRIISVLPVMCFALNAFAGTVIYTDSAHPVSSVSSDIPVIYLDAVAKAEQDLFGQLPTDATQAEKQAREIVGSSAFIKQQQQIQDAYQGVVRAWSLGVKKYPAIVFDDRWVVYGTTDINLARQYLTNVQEAKP
ncbi:TIGR03757 family integrating conjugative element protein [Pectobacterium versatile]|uniref:TIGR03757 family integrating conjugative element protein n=1 Tax=Pectobacterium versatile TaxID=2488639 RepID=UPI000C7F0BD8|nr:TIGR03757 family integrating conjugative element protein [Pectobacterium versatile]PLY36684.1 TIGR03757 family integrating conjugative element protein [Pectobacterium carotovorum]